ncbi:MAG: DUF1285 domain-containing protein [Marinobacter sp.]|uniref:DUF1285 domain-containing protein n=1 Tax=Marinobacter sp. TaxID=50741 RepID=UPI00299E223C|nr:DUF1285 domain-containing protein [Marinobacter sp.]MDX1634372.1 DUF1285 domain-containing protein [Marinobacter sp.]
MSQNPDKLESQLAGVDTRQSRPPIEKWNPELSGDIDIRIARDGTWYFQGGPMAREALVRLFSTILRRESDGEYYLVTPVEKWRILVEDTPLLAHGLEVSGQGEDQVIHLTTNTGERVRVDDQHPLRVGSYPDSDEPRPMVLLEHGLEARLVTAAFYELAGYVTEQPGGDSNRVGVWSAGVFFELGEGA